MSWFACLLEANRPHARAPATRGRSYEPDPSGGLAALAARHRLPAARFGAVHIVQEERAPVGEEWTYRVERREVRAALDDRPSAIALVSAVFRAPGLSRDEFLDHWRDRHAPLALRHHVGMTEYWQLAVVEAFGAAAPAYDGIAILGFPDERSLAEGLYDSREGRRAIAEDTARFVDVARLEVAILIERRS